MEAKVRGNMKQKPDMRQLGRTWLTRILVRLAATVLLCTFGRSAWIFLKFNWNTVTFPFPLDYGEGPVLDQVMHMAKFQNIYRLNPTSMPYTISNYPPFYQLIQVPFAWIFGPAYWYGRSISCLSIVAAAVFIFLTLHTITKDKIASLSGSLMLFALPYILGWSPFCRVDSLALGVSWGGLFVLVRWPENHRAMIISAFLLTAAIYTRQSYALAAPIAAFTWQIGQRQRLDAFKLAAWVLGLVAGLFVIINLLTQGGFFFNIVTSNINQFFWQTVAYFAIDIWKHMPYLVISSFLFMLIAVWFRVRTWWLATPYLLASVASAVTIGKVGSNINYLFELSAGLSFMAGAILAAAGRRWWWKIVLMSLLAIQVFFLHSWTRQYCEGPMARVDNDQEAIAQLQRLVNEAEGPVLADEFMGLVPLSGRQLYFQPFEFKQLSAARVWDERPFIDDIYHKKWALILLYNPPYWNSIGERWTEAQILAIEANYAMVGRYADTIICKPIKAVSQINPESAESHYKRGMTY